MLSLRTHPNSRIRLGPPQYCHKGEIKSGFIHRPFRALKITLRVFNNITE